MNALAVPAYEGPIDEQGRIPVTAETLPAESLVQKIRDALELRKRRISLGLNA